MSTIKPSDLFRYYRQGTPHQMAAIVELEAELLKRVPDLFNRDQPWFKTWSQAGKQPDLAPNTWLGVSESAKKAGAKFPELVAAQWALESGWGKHLSGKHNYFGLKGSGTSKPTQEFISGQWITITDSFIDFPDLQSCVQYLVDRWHKDYKLYKGVNRAASRDAAAQMLVSEGYATDPTYAQKLKKLMSENAPSASPLPMQQGVLIDVPYEAQNDNASGTGYRECFSSSAAMVARYYGKIANDDAYNKFRAKYGDTTDAKAQVNALKALGLNARFITNCTVALLEAELNAGRPVMVGWLHKGAVTAPTGGGHWSVVIGYTPSAFIHNDPNGEANLIQGGYVNTVKGKAVSYNRSAWLKRWLVEGANSGWALLVSR